MEWLSQNWLLLSLLIMCPAMHLLFCARGHGHHGAYADERDALETNKDTARTRLTTDVTHKGDVA
jgi:hypothetical protein